MVFTVSQIYLSDAISGRDKALENLRNQINELSKILVIETKEKEKIISQLEDTEESLSQKQSDLLKQEEYSKTLQTDIAKKDSEIFIQDQYLIALSDQLKKLLYEFVYWKDKKYSRSKMQEGADNLPWEKEAYEKTSNRRRRRNG